MTIKQEIRTAELRALADDTGLVQIVEGYALVFDKPTVLFRIGDVDYIEVIASGALDGADLSDVPFKYNHADNVMVMARTRNGTLQLVTDAYGLKVHADLAQTTTGKDMYELIRRKDIDKMSFAFTVKEDSYNSETHTRTIMQIDKLYDVSAVDMPAYDQTSISARSYFEERQKEELQSMEAAALEANRQKLKLKLIL